MNIEQQVCSLGLAKKLKSLGVPQNSLWFWTDCNIKPNVELWDRGYGHIGNKIASAFTTSELGELLPKYLDKEEYIILSLDFPHTADGWVVYYSDTVNDKECGECEAKTEADARAKLLIWLLENNYIKFEKGVIW